MEVQICLVLLVEDTSSFSKDVIRGLLVMVCSLLRYGLTVLSMWSVGSKDNLLQPVVLSGH